MNEDKIKKDLEEIETINIELDHRVSKLIAENEHLKQTFNLKSVEISNLNASLQEKVLEITALKDDLRKLKGKNLVDNVVTKHTIDPEMLKIDVEPITPKLLNKKTAHFAYIKHTQEEATVIMDLVEHDKSIYPLDHSLESACRYAKLIQELLTHISKTYPSVNNTDGKLVAVIPKNKDKRVRFTEPVISSRNSITKTTSTSNLVSNKPMLSSTRVKPSTSASGSQPSGNTKKDKIQQTPSNTQKNKVEAHPRKVKSSLKNKDCVVQPKGTAYVQHSKLNANPELKCVKCNEKKSLKPTGQVFTNIGYIWRPTGRTFTIVGNACPLTRITTTAEVPLRKPTALENEIPKPVVTLVYSRKPRKSQTNIPVSKSKYLDSGCSKHMIGDRSQLTNFVNKFLGIVKFGNDHVAKILGYGGYQIGNVTILRVYFVEGLGHNLFSVKCLRLKDEAPDFIIKFLKMIQVRLKVPVRRIRTDNGTEFVNQTLRKYYEKAEAVATVCYTQNHSIIRLRHGKTPYELLHEKPPIIFPCIWGTLLSDELTAMASEHDSLGPALHEMTPATISSGLVSNPSPSTSFVPPSRTDWDILFQPMFDDLLTPSPSVDYPATEVVAPIHKVVAPVPTVSTGSPSSTNVNQDAPSPSHSQTPPETQPPIIPNDVDEDNHDIQIAHMGNDPYFGISIPEISSDQSSSSDSIHTIVHPDHQISEHNSKWTKDHPLENIIGELARPVSTRLQLHEQALFCYYDAFLTVVEPNTYKDALTQSCWIEAMQEELNEFERLEV
ncbi:retrovirus-related pol polyprotein from transposon TNT 1-94 [Tanacetum coccineum]